MSTPANRDHHIQLSVIDPGTHNTNMESLKHCWDIKAAFNRNEAGSMTFKTFKDSPGSPRLQEDVTIVLRLWDPWKKEYVEPPNARFIVSTWSEDLTDPTNVITYACLQEVRILEKLVLHRANHDWKLNNAFDKAEEAFNNAERDYESKLKQFDELATWVRRRHGFTSGKNFAYYGLGWIRRARNVPWGSIASDASRGGKLFYWSNKRKKWLALPMNTWPRNKERLVKLGADTAKARRVYRARLKEFKRAERAARETSRDGRRFFYNNKPMQTLYQAWVEGHIRDRDSDSQGTGVSYMEVKGLRRSWTNDRDSRGHWWSARSSHDFALGANFYDMLQEFVARGDIDWQMRGRTLDIVPQGRLQVDQTNRISLRLGKDMTEGGSDGSRMDHASRVCVIAGNGYSYMLDYGIPFEAADTPWGYWEASMSASESEGEVKARGITHRARQEISRRFRIESSRQAVVTLDSALPMIDYQPHHIISTYDNNGDQRARVVEQVIVSQDNQDSPVMAAITLESRQTNVQVKFAKSIAKTLSGVGSMEGTIPPLASLVAPTVAEGSSASSSSFAPPISNLSASLRFDQHTGTPSVVIRATFMDAGLNEPQDPAMYDTPDALDETETDPGDEFGPGEPGEDGSL